MARNRRKPLILLKNETQLLSNLLIFLVNEIVSFSTNCTATPTLRGLGLGRRMLDHLAAYALQHGVHVLRLETGTYQPEARHLYERYGFQRIPPFGEYEEGPFHLFYEKHIP
jgi:GNAT superfamily N-acetyltransferase